MSDSILPAPSIDKLRERYWSLRRSVGFFASKVGDRLGLESLTYNVVTYEFFDSCAAAAAPGFVESVLTMFPSVGTVVDFGCGTGRFVQAFNEKGVAAHGLEYSPKARQMANEKLGLHIRPLDLADAISPTIEPADLAMSLEVAEHVPVTLGRTLVDLLVQTAPLVIFTAARPGQGGTGHVNEQPQSYWIELFRLRKCAFDEEASATLSASLRGNVAGSPWIADNVMVFHRQEQL